MAKIKGRVVVCTGAGQGIGKTVAEFLAKEGASVAVVDVNAEAARNVSDAICAAGDNAIAVAADVCNEASIKKMIGETVDTFGRIDGLYNGAGIAGQTADIHEQTVEFWNQIIAVNLTGSFMCIKFAVPEMIKAGGGSIVNVSSTAGFRVSDYGHAPYIASKHAIVGLTKAAAVDLAEHAIRVNAVAPGPIRTSMIQEYLDSAPGLESYMTNRLPLARLGKTEEIAKMVSFLMSDDAAYCTGSIYEVNGGDMAGTAKQQQLVLQQHFLQ